MLTSKLHTRQYDPAELRPGGRPKVAGKHVGRTVTVMLAVGLAEWWGSGTAQADPNREKEACALLSDYGAAGQFGEEPAWYALRVLSTEMPRGEAELVLGHAVTDYCPNHA